MLLCQPINVIKIMLLRVFYKNMICWCRDYFLEHWIYISIDILNKNVVIKNYNPWLNEKTRIKSL